MRRLRSLLTAAILVPAAMTAGVLSGAGPAAALSVAPAAIAFGPVPVGSYALDHVDLFPDPGYTFLVITNNQSPLVATGTNCDGTSQPCTATVEFAPTTTGDFTSTVSFGECLITTGGDCRDIVVDLSGTGVEVGTGTATVTPASVAPGGRVAVTSVSPCPRGSDSAWVVVHAQDGTHEALARASFTDSADNWTATFTAPTGNGTYVVYANCYNAYAQIVETYTTTSLTVGATTTDATASPSPVDFGQPTTVTATVAFGSADSTPTGSVTLTDGMAALATVPLVAGVATWTSSTLSLGTHHIVATYSGNGTPSSGAVDVVVRQAPTALVAGPTRRTTTGTTFSATLASDGTPLAGQIVTFSARTVLGKWRVQCSATTESTGVATCHTPNRLAVGFSTTYQASFAGTTEYTASIATAKYAY